MRTLVLTAALCILAGCGTPPHQTAPAAANAALASKAETQGAAPQTAAAGEEEREFKPPAGYKTKIVGWNVLYCKRTVVLGSRFPKEICMTEAELKEHLAATDEMRRDKDEVSRICTSAVGCAWN